MIPQELWQSVNIFASFILFADVCLIGLSNQIVQMTVSAKINSFLSSEKLKLILCYVVVNADIALSLFVLFRRCWFTKRAFHDSSLMLSNFSIYRCTTATVNNWD